MQPDFFDNRTKIVKDDLVRTIKKGDKVSVAASVFSMYAYQELCDQLKDIDEFRFIFTSKAFTADRAPKEKREFYIPRLQREQSLFGTEFEIKLRNELTQKAIATECANWVRKKARFKSFTDDVGMGITLLGIDSPDDAVAYTPFSGFTTSELGVKRARESYSVVMRQDDSNSKMLLRTFDDAWNSGQLADVTDAVVDSIQTMYQENAPELVYYLALYRIFSEFLDDISEDVLPDDRVGFKESKVWKSLYDFQKDAAIAIINKLETYRGCILADSVGLGKTFTALAVIKYYECRNKDVLVLCPKKLSDNWRTYNSNVVNNPFAEDRFGYDVLYHTDLSRERGMSDAGIPLDRINWGNYDLVVIDESHNFRNGADSASKADDKQNRYQKLLDKVVLAGKVTKVLMLSATPVNNRFRDLRNQLALAYTGDPSRWEGKLKIDTDIETVFANAQKVFTRWSKLPADQRTTDALTKMLDFDFFEVLDQVTVARSRKHIQRYYDMSAIGPFPKRNKPISKRPKLSTLPDAVNYREIYEQLDSLTLSVYIPSSYIQPSKAAKYEQDGNLTMRGREYGIRKLMTTNLLKRLESSVHSFRLTLERVRNNMNDALEAIDDYKRTRTKSSFTDVSDKYGYDFDADDEEDMAFEVGRSVKVDIADMDWMSWERDIMADVENIDVLLAMIEDIDPTHDAKLIELCDQIREKAAHPINPGNRKVIVFTAFADTAAYLFEHVSSFAKRELGLETAMVTGTGSGKSTVKGLPADMGTILTCFSPISKERDAVAKQYTSADIDVLIATDCISEGQNLQDCDYLVNYDIHWNPVRIVQRFGRIDRIGSKNNVIQLVNYWPDVELDEYIKLKARVEERMRITVMTSTGDDDYINEDERGDLEYRERQLRQMRDEVIDLEDVSGGVSITDLGLNEFRMDLVGYHAQNPDIDRLPSGINAVVQGPEPGIVFVLRNVNQGVNIQGRNQLHPFYLVYVGEDGAVLHGHLSPKEVLDNMRLLCRGKSEPDLDLCRSYNRETRNGRDMRAASRLLGAAISSIIDSKAETDIDSFFSGGTTSFLEDDVQGLDDFELVCFLVVR